MNIIVNGDPIQTQQSNLLSLLDEQGFSADMVATAIDGEFVAIEHRAATQLTEGCAVEIVAPMQGG